MQPNDETTQTPNQPLEPTTPPTPTVAPVNPPTSSSTTQTNSQISAKKPFPKKLFIIVGAVLAVLIIGFFAVKALTSNNNKPSPIDNNPVRNTATDDEREKPKYTLEKDSWTGTYEPFGSDETKDNSAEAFIDYKNAIINNQDSTQEEIFDAKIALLTYYINEGFYKEADSIIASIDQSTLYDYQFEILTVMSDKLNESRNS